jgi:hypothetical protein
VEEIVTAGLILLLAAVLFPVAVRGTTLLMNHLGSQAGNHVVHHSLNH